MNKIFQIGFNKCGTYSLYNLFQYQTNPKIRSIHWDSGNLALSIEKNLLAGKKLLSDYNDYVFFSDMESVFYSQNAVKIIEAYKYFELLDTQYPNSKFILNTRNINKWINSRLKHSGTLSRLINTEIVSESIGYKYISYYMHYYSTEDLDLIKTMWINNYIQHISMIKQYFINRPDDFIEYDIENDSITKLSNFFQSHIKFNTDKLSHDNKTKDCP